jgi:tryptophanyl-tRNA synthetase
LALEKFVVKTSLTGIKPTGTPHLGNWVGAIRPALELVKSYQTIYFIADYHALTTERDPKSLRRYIYDVAATWIACGLDPQKTLLFRQSAVIEVCELTWIFGCITATGQLERGHAYKEAMAQGEAPNAGVFNYPLLMAADIILYDTHLVPVGVDQKQHLELARDIAIRLNHVYGENTVVVPEALVTASLQIPGADGRKMSKSYGNTIPLFEPSSVLRKSVMKIESDSTPLEEPKDPEAAYVYQIYRAIATPEQSDELARKLRAGGYGWGHAKQELYELIESLLGPMRQRYQELRADEKALDAILLEGADKARMIARRTIARVRAAIGIDG